MGGTVSGAPSFGAGPEAILDVAVQVARDGLALPAEVTLAAREAAPELAELAPVKLRQALENIILAPNLGAGLQWLHDAGALAVVLPELEATVDFSQEAGRRHKDVWEHTKQVVRQAPENALVRWSALLHDIGKVPTRVMLPDGRVTFHRHAEVGARMFDGVARRLQFDREGRQRIRFLIYNHLRANAFHCSWTDSAVRRFDLEMGRYLDDLIELSLADVTSRRPGRRQEASDNIQALLKRDPRRARARRQGATAARRPGQRLHAGLRHPRRPPHRRAAEAVRGRDREGRAGRAAGRRLLRRLPPPPGRHVAGKGLRPFPVPHPC